MTEFRRGFKAETERLVVDIRNEFGVPPRGRLDAFKLAKWLDIETVPISHAGPEALGKLEAVNCNFNAATVRKGHGHIIFYNDLSNSARQQSDIAHELGHIYLEHEMSPISTGDKLRDIDVEKEADWFGFALLIPTQAALSIARANLTDAEGAELLGVSEEALRYRMNMTGARKRARQNRRY